MLYRIEEDTAHIIGPEMAAQFLAEDIQFRRVFRAWDDDHELCIDVVCALRDGAEIKMSMEYCVACDSQWGELLSWSLTGQQEKLRVFFQARLIEGLNAHVEYDHRDV